MGGACSRQKHQAKDELVTTKDYNLSSKGSMEHVDSTKCDSKNRFVPLMISDPKMLDCCICFQPLNIPVYQCDSGHIVCSTCCSTDECHICSLPISSKHCKAIEKFLLSIKMSCPNAKHGCKEKISHTKNRNHEEECIYETCYCPLSRCDFVSSAKSVYNHFSHKHENSRIKFSYGHSFIVSLKPNDEKKILQEENDGKLFILNNNIMELGNEVSIYCIGPASSEFEYFYDILAKSQICEIKLQSFAMNIQEFTSWTSLSSKSLMIPFGSFDPLKIKIRIANPVKQIYIRELIGRITPLKVKSSDTIIRVKMKILKKIGVQLHEQRLVANGKQLEDDVTLAHYNIQDNSVMHLVLRLCGN